MNVENRVSLSGVGANGTRLRNMAASKLKVK